MVSILDSNKFLVLLPDGMNMCDNCQDPYDTSSQNSCGPAQHRTLPACMSTHKNFSFLFKKLFIPVRTSCPFLSVIHYIIFIILSSPSLISLSLTTHFMQCLLLNFQTEYDFLSILHIITGSVYSFTSCNAV
jgi:hypothetical protein